MAKLPLCYNNNSNDDYNSDDDYSSIYSSYNKNSIYKPKLNITREISPSYNQYLYKDNNGDVHYFESPHNINQIKHIWVSRKKYELDIIKKNRRLYVKTFKSLHHSYSCEASPNNILRDLEQHSVDTIFPSLASSNSMIAVEDLNGDIAIIDDHGHGINMGDFIGDSRNNTMMQIFDHFNLKQITGAIRSNHSTTHAPYPQQIVGIKPNTSIHAEVSSNNDYLTDAQKSTILKSYKKGLKIFYLITSVVYAYDPNINASDSDARVVPIIGSKLYNNHATHKYIYDLL